MITCCSRFGGIIALIDKPPQILYSFYMNEEELQRRAAQAFGRMGGKATLQKYGKEHYQEMQRKGVETKLRKKSAQR